MPRGTYHRANSLPGHGRPTAKQREAWEAVERTGSQIEAAAAIGISQGAIQTRLRGFQHAMGITGRLPGARVYKNGVTRGTGPWAQLRATIARLEAEVERLTGELEAERSTFDQDRERLTETIAALTEQAHPWVAVHAKLDAILARPTGVAFAPDHRRVSDGGRTVKDQRRALRPTG